MRTKKDVWILNAERLCLIANNEVSKDLIASTISKPWSCASSL